MLHVTRNLPKMMQVDMHVVKPLSANSRSTKPALSSLDSSSFLIASTALIADEHVKIEIMILAAHLTISF